MRRVSVELGARSYDVLVGRGARQELAAAVASATGPKGRKAAIVTQAGIAVAVDPGIEHRVFEIGDGEQHKSLATIEDLCRRFAQWGLTRSDCVIGVGGGIVTDVAGFAAAVYHRGVAVIHVPTTLLGMVDAAVGGKTGVNLPEGKNLVGAFWQPSAVLCDLDVLATLPPRELRCGLGEIAKYHFLTGDDLMAMDIDDRIAHCVQIKAEVVSGDEREAGRRAILNYGHTLAHALEIEGDHDLRHGEAVAIGLVYAAELAAELGRIDSVRVQQHRRVVASYDLPTAIPAGMSPERLVELMHRDKKASGGLTFVLDGPGGIVTVDDVPAATVRRVLDRMEIAS